MPAPIPVTSSGLRQAMRDRRYWQPGHPGRAGRQAWVSDGWRRLAKGGSGGDGVVWVAPHTRHRDGEAQEVRGHYRHAGRGAMPPDGGDRTRRRVRTAEQDLPDGGRRVTVRDADGGLIGQCDSLADGSQICTLGLPDGRVVVQEFAAQGGEIVPVGGPLAVPAIVEAAPLFMAATELFRQLNERRRRASAELGDAGGDYTPVLILNRGFEGTAAGVRVAVGQLSPDRVNEFCPKTGEFDELLASVAAATPGEGLTPQQRGTAIHTAVRDALAGCGKTGRFGWTAHFRAGFVCRLPRCNHIVSARHPFLHENSLAHPQPPVLPQPASGDLSGPQWGRQDGTVAHRRWDSQLWSGWQHAPGHPSSCRRNRYNLRLRHKDRDGRIARNAGW